LPQCHDYCTRRTDRCCHCRTVLVGLGALGGLAALGRMVKIFELACLLEVTPLPSPTLRLVFLPIITDTHRQCGWHRVQEMRGWTGNTCWRISLGQSIKHCCCATSTW